MQDFLCILFRVHLRLNELVNLNSSFYICTIKFRFATGNLVETFRSISPFL